MADERLTNFEKTTIAIGLGTILLNILGLFITIYTDSHRLPFPRTVDVFITHHEAGIDTILTFLTERTTYKDVDSASTDSQGHATFHSVRAGRYLCNFIFKDSLYCYDIYVSGDENQPYRLPIKYRHKGIHTPFPNNAAYRSNCLMERFPSVQSTLSKSSFFDKLFEGPWAWTPAYKNKNHLKNATLSSLHGSNDSGRFVQGWAYNKRNAEENNAGIGIINHPKKSVPPTIKFLLDQKTVHKRQDSTAVVLHSQNNKLMSISSFPEADTPDVHHDIYDPIGKDSSASEGLVMFWTDCRNCDWLIHFTDPDHIDQPVPISADIQTRLSQNSPLIKFKSGQKHYFNITDKAGNAYRYYSIQTIPGKIVIIRIRKKPNGN